MVVSGWAAREAEVEAAGTTVRLRVIPLAPDGVRTAALVLCRDVTEVRRRERELVGKDATIREIHHRVKNNLQTVAALLRLQARRLGDGDEAAREALREAERRIGSIAVVHETLSRTGDAASTSTRSRTGSPAWSGSWAPAVTSGSVRRRARSACSSPEVATPLALVLVELVQNAVEHGLRGRAVARSRWTCDRATRRCGWRSATTAPACPRASTRPGTPGWACRSCGPWSRASSAGSLRLGPRTRRRDRGGGHAVPPPARREPGRRPRHDEAPAVSAGASSVRSRSGQAVRARLRAVRRLRARRSSSLIAPQTPAS